MTQQRELELKFEIAPRDAERLRRDPLLAWSPVSEQHQESIYFDTPKGKLRRAGYTLRVRRSGRKRTQTIKSRGDAAGLFDRSEWEAPVRAMRPDLQAARQTPLASVLAERAGARLRPLARIRIARTSWVVDDGSSCIEVTSDRGVVTAGAAEGPVSELELELKRGSAAALFDLTEALARHLPLRLSVLSKADRALAIAEGKAGKVAKAPKVKLTAEMTVADALATVLLSCLKHFRLNEPLLVDQHLTEALHQARVAMRRLRSAFLLFRPVIRHDPEYDRLRKDLRRISRRLGDARNLDVFVEGLGGIARELPQLQHLRDEHYARIIATLDSKRFLGMMLRLVRWLSIGAWRERPEAQLPIARFLQGRIDKAWARLAAPGGQLAALAEDERHRFRIRVKNFRYALEFARALHRDQKPIRKQFGAAIRDLQEQLGALNDMSVARSIVDKYLDGNWPQAEPDEAERTELLAEAERNFARMVAIGPYSHAPVVRPPAATSARRQGGSARPAASRRHGPRSGGSARG